MKIALGTAQFGLDYGISNREGKTPAAQANEILGFAYSKGIRSLDTASAYGNSEEVIGSYLDSHRDEKWKVISKLPMLKAEETLEADFDDYFERSRSRLGASLHTYLAHAAGQFLGNPSVRNRFHSLKERGLIDKIGVSVYSAEEIYAILDLGGVDVIQLPLNILDHRLIKGGVLKKIKKNRIEIHARSVFLQGLLLLSEEDLSNMFEDALAAVRKLKKIAREYELELRDLALLFVNSIQEVDLIIIGVNNPGQLRENIESLEKRYDHGVTEEILRRIDYDNEKVLNPALWNA